MADRLSWGRVAHARGISPEPHSQRRLTGPTLATRITEACAPVSIAAASALGDQATRERGPDRAVATIERTVSAGRDLRGYRAPAATAGRGAVLPWTRHQVRWTTRHSTAPATIIATLMANWASDPVVSSPTP